MTRIYSIRDSWKSDAKVLRWGASRFGDKHDPEMEKAVADGHKIPGDGKPFCVDFTPEMPRFKSPAQCREQRIRNMRKRIQQRDPLFADQFEVQELKRDYFSLEKVTRDQETKKAYFEKWILNFWNEHSPDKEVKL